MRILFYPDERYLLRNVYPILLGMRCYYLVNKKVVQCLGITGKMSRVGNFFDADMVIYYSPMKCELIVGEYIDVK